MAQAAGHDINYVALTGNIGAAWRPGTAWKLAIDLSTGFRSPNIDDVGKVFSNEPGTVIVPNPELGPEYAYSAEVSAEKTIVRPAVLSVVAIACGGSAPASSSSRNLVIVSRAE